MFAAISLFVLLSLPHPAFPDTPQKSFEAIAREADAARQADHLIDALKLYSEAVHLHPTWADGWWWLGSILYEQDRFSEAQASFKRFIALSPKPAPAYAFLALCEYETQDYALALHHFELWSNAHSPGKGALLDVASFHWALLLTRAGRFNEALFILAAKAKQRETAPVLTEAIGLASLRMAFLPEDYPPERRESVWLAGMAEVYNAQSESRLSDAYAERLLSHYGQEPNVHYFRGILLRFQGNEDSAAEEFQKELEISPRHVPALTEWAASRLEAGYDSEALSLAKRAIEIDPQSARAHYILGRALLETGSFHESAQELEIAKRLAPESSRVRFALSTAYKRLGRKQDSEREQAAFLALKDKDNVLAPLGDKFKTPQATEHPQ
jgi:tetratricopeptide (TPR) repeat protein